MSKKEMLQFLKDLRDNNSKEWMDKNRSLYHTAKDRWIEEVEAILKRLSKHNPHFTLVRPKDTLSRINNNRRFHPDKPVYKDFFSCEPAGKMKGSSLFYFAAGCSWSFVGGGLYNPEKEQLQAYREAIDYDGKAFEVIVNAKGIKDFYGGLTHYQDQLKTAPRGHNTDHPYIQFLRYRSITATRDLSEKEILSKHFIDLIEEAYIAFKPLEDYLLKILAYHQEMLQSSGNGDNY